MNHGASGPKRSAFSISSMGPRAFFLIIYFSQIRPSSLSPVLNIATTLSVHPTNSCIKILRSQAMSRGGKLAPEVNRYVLMPHDSASVMLAASIACASAVG